MAGDLYGWRCWQLPREGRGTAVLFTKEVRVRSLLERRGSFLSRPVLTANHRHMMRSGERGLRAFTAASK